METLLGALAQIFGSGMGKLIFAIRMDEKHLKEVHTCVRKKQANMDTPSNGEDAQK